MIRNDDWRSLSWEEIARAIKDAETWSDVEDMVEYVIDFWDLDIDFEAPDWEDRIYAWCDQHLGEDGTVLDENGEAVDYEAAVNLMDDDLREELHSELAPCSNQEFFNAYAKAHKERFGEDFAPAVGKPW